MEELMNNLQDAIQGWLEVANELNLTLGIDFQLARGSLGKRSHRVAVTCG